MDLTLLSLSVKVFEFELKRFGLWTPSLSLTVNETLRWLLLLPTLNAGVILVVTA